MYLRKKFLWSESQGRVYGWVELPKNASNGGFEINELKRLGNFVVNLELQINANNFRMPLVTFLGKEL